MILDNRVHRTVKISGATEYNLVPSSPYTVLLKVIGGKDTLVVSKDGNPIASIPSTKTFTPPACPSPVAKIDNPSCQFQLDIDDQLYRIIELQQNLIDPNAGTALIMGSVSGNLPPSYSHTLLYNVNGVAIPMSDGGFKVPPDLGEAV